MTMRLINAKPDDFTGDPRFTGTASGVHVTLDEDPQLHAYVVRFEPSARTAWHSHERGQLLICTGGSGLVGTRDGAVLELRPGLAVWTDAGEEHWHGAGPRGELTHVAVQTETPGGDAVHWLEELTDADWARAFGLS